MTTVAAPGTSSTNGTVCVYGQTKGDFITGSTTDTDVFLACYDKLGARKWLRQLGTPGIDQAGNQIAVANNGDVYVTGTTDKRYSLAV